MFVDMFSRSVAISVAIILIRSFFVETASHAQEGRAFEEFADGEVLDDAIQEKLNKASCPPDTVPFYTRKLPKTCSTKQAARPCPGQGFYCHEDVVANVSICCGKVAGCRQGQPHINIQSNRAVICLLTPKQGPTANQCPSHLICQEKSPGAKLGYCCPPIGKPATPAAKANTAGGGCPWGTKPMKSTVEKASTSCIVGQPSSCPDGSKCHVDTVDNSSRCCATDQSDGCPDGYKPMKKDGEKVRCSPNGNPSAAACPTGALCHLNVQTGSHQCCEADSGCPEGTRPVLDGTDQPRKCLNSSVCPPGTTCSYNSRRNQSQCCTSTNSTVAFCPKPETPLIDPKTKVIVPCSSREPCPSGSACRTRTDGLGGGGQICCMATTVGLGRCPLGYLSVKETSISASLGPEECDQGGHGCKSPAVCLRAVDAPQSHSLCCLPTPQCVYSIQTPYLDQLRPKVCSNHPTNTSECPGGYRCEESTVPSIFICCSSVSRMPPPSPVAIASSSSSTFGTSPWFGVSITTIAPPSSIDLKCPQKFELQKYGAISCDPQVPSTCQTGSRCLPANKAGYFVCCTPVSPISNARCTTEGAFVDSQTGAPQSCNPNFIFTGCPQTHSLCLFYPPIGRHTCCRVPICPNGLEPFWSLGTTIPRHCGNVETSDCPFGYACMHSPIFDSGVCCLSRARMRNSVVTTGDSESSPPFEANGHHHHHEIGSSHDRRAGVQEQRRVAALLPWSQFGDFRLAPVKK